MARSAPSKWRHGIRAVDAQGRFRLREASELDGFDGQLFARLRPTGWELRPVGPAGTAVPVDVQGRVTILVGVRHHLGIAGSVVVSTDGIRIVVWPLLPHRHASRGDPPMSTTLRAKAALAEIQALGLTIDDLLAVNVLSNAKEHTADKY